MPINLLGVFAQRLRYLFTSAIAVVSLSACQVNSVDHYFASHLAEDKKAAFLHELIYSLKLNKESQLLYRLYGHWGYSLTPLDVDRKRNGSCEHSVIVRDRVRTRKDISYYHFFSDVFEQDIHIMNRKENDCGYELYLEEFINHPKLNEAVNLALLRFKEIAQRLELLYFRKLDLIEKYDDIEHLTTAIDKDIVSLSKAGYKLAESTKNFFQLAKEQLAIQDVASVRNIGMGDLKTLSASLEQVKQSQFLTIEEATLATIQALENLQQDINQ